MTDPARAAQPPAVGDASFDAYYFAHCCGDPYTRSESLLKFFHGIADRIIADIAPASVLDAGCAIGLLVEALRERGVEASGIDLSSYAIGQVDERVRGYCRHASVADELASRYGLIVSIEVLEHVPVRAAEAAIANFCRHTDDVLFSSSPLDYKEPTHVNVHPPEYWAAEFARHGFYRDVDFDASYITPWATRFRRSTEPLHRIVRNYERRFWELTLERNDTRTFSTTVQQQLAAELDRAKHTSALVEQQTELLRQQDAQLQQQDAALKQQAAALAAGATARQELERATAQLAALRDDHAAQAAARQRAETELAQARDRIFHMERSAFWRARTVWQRLRGAR